MISVENYLAAQWLGVYPLSYLYSMGGSYQHDEASFYYCTATIHLSVTSVYTHQ